MNHDALPSPKKLLATFRAKNLLLGTERPRRRLTPEEGAKGRAAAQAAIAARTDAAHAKIGPTINALRQKGLSYRDIADVLNANDVTTRNGCRWCAEQVARVLKRAAKQVPITR